MPATRTDHNESTRKERFELAIARLSDLPTVPNTLLRIWQLVDDPDSSAADLEKVITVDQSLTAKIIRLVNSPYYGLRAEVTSARQAVTLLGFDTVKNLSICVSVVSACLPDRNENPELRLDDLWKHSVATGVLAQKIARQAGFDDPDTAFTAGVLHDIGKFVMNLTLRGDYGEAIRLARNRGIFLHEAETATFDADHQYFGGCLASMWGFPGVLTDVIRTHHAPPDPDGEPDAVHAVRLANTAARILGVGSSGNANPPQAGPETFAGIGVAGDRTSQFLDEGRALVEEAQDILNLLD